MSYIKNNRCMNSNMTYGNVKKGKCSTRNCNQVIYKQKNTKSKTHQLEE